MTQPLIPADVEIDVFDVWAMATMLLQQRGIEPTAITVKTWNKPVLRFEGSTLVEPTRHHLVATHSKLFPHSK